MLPAMQGFVYSVTFGFSHNTRLFAGPTSSSFYRVPSHSHNGWRRVSQVIGYYVVQKRALAFSFAAHRTMPGGVFFAVFYAAARRPEITPAVIARIRSLSGQVYKR